MSLWADFRFGRENEKYILSVTILASNRQPSVTPMGQAVHLIRTAQLVDPLLYIGYISI
jgi:hypothetical protein